jgi:hypothetical protein
MKAAKSAKVTNRRPSFIFLGTASKLTKYNPKSRTTGEEVYALKSSTLDSAGVIICIQPDRESGVSIGAPAGAVRP